MNNALENHKTEKGVELKTDIVKPHSYAEVPFQYKGLPSEIVEEMWTLPEYVNPETNRQEKERREQALTALRSEELKRQGELKQQFEMRYASLSQEEKNIFPVSQSEVAAVVMAYIQGKEEIQELSSEEYLVLSKIKDGYIAFKRDHPNDIFKFEMGKEYDKHVYENLQYRLAFINLSNKREVLDRQKLSEVRSSLQLPQSKQDTKREELQKQPKVENSTEVNENTYPLDELKRLLDKRAERSTKGRKIWDDLFERYRAEGNKEKIAGVLMGEFYNEKRMAEYSFNSSYELAWKYATENNTLEHRVQNGWIYRGKFPKGSESKTETRGSLNITIDVQAIQELDSLIQDGIIEANYKFGEPNTLADAAERHDAVTLYFLNPPSEQGLAALSAISKKYFRGNNLLGKQIADGFYMSEIGSVTDSEARDFINRVNKIDAQLGIAVKQYLTSTKSGKERVAMSEAQYYAVKDALKAFGIDVNFSERGFKLQRLQLS